MTVPPRWKILGPAVLAAATLVSGLAALLAITSLSGPLMAGRVFGFADSHDRRAFQILERGATPAEVSVAEVEIQRALALAPYDNAARLRLTYIDTVREHALTPLGRTWLAESYDLVPFDHTVAAWRVGFALEHWERLTPDLRKAVEAEAMAFYRENSQDANVTQVLKSVRNPAGRLAAALWLQPLAR